MDFYSYLEQELERRSQSNPAYSLRAFARDLGLDPSNLSKVISRKMKLKESSQESILMRLGVQPDQLSKYVLKTPNENLGRLPEKAFLDVSHDELLISSDWHYDAVLELTRLKSFTANTKWIAKSLGLTELQVKQIVSRLKRRGYLSVDSNGKWIDQQGDVSTYLNPQVGKESAKMRQRNLLEKSKSALNSVPIEFRDHSSTTLAIQMSDMAEAKKIIQSFRKTLAAFLQRKETSPDQVYQLQVSFFPLTKIIETTHQKKFRPKSLKSNLKNKKQEKSK